MPNIVGHLTITQHRPTSREPKVQVSLPNAEYHFIDPGLHAGLQERPPERISAC